MAISTSLPGVPSFFRISFDDVTRWPNKRNTDNPHDKPKQMAANLLDSLADSCETTKSDAPAAQKMRHAFKNPPNENLISFLARPPSAEALLFMAPIPMPCAGLEVLVS